MKNIPRVKLVAAALVTLLVLGLPFFVKAETKQGDVFVGSQNIENTDQQVPDSDFRVVDEFRDEADLGNGKKAYKIYEKPRSIFKTSEGIYRLRPVGWSIFNDEMSKAKLVKRTSSNYSYQVDTNGDKILFSGGDLEKQKIGKLSGNFSNFKQVKNSEGLVSEYKNVYNNVDFKFLDEGVNRTKIININKRPTDLDKSGDWIFWEKISLPDGAGVFVNNNELIGEKIVDGVVDIRYHANTLSITPAIIYDSKYNSPDYQENASRRIKEIVRLSADGKTLEIGLMVEAEYLADPNVVFPVVIDPTYSICQSGSSTCVTNFYLRYLTSQDTTNADLFMGYDYIESGNPCGPPTGHASRHAVLKFPVSTYIPSGSTITTAKVRLSFDAPANCGVNYSGSVSMRPKKINTYWSDPASLQYTNIRGSLSSGGTASNVSTSDAQGTVKEWSLDLSMVQSWLDSPSGNYGFLLEPNEDWTSGTTPPTSWTSKERNFKFFSTRSSNSARWPYLYVVTTDPKPNLTTNSNDYFTPVTVQTNQQVALTLNIKNSSNVAVSQSSVVKYYINPSGSCMNRTTYLGSFTISSLAANGVYSKTVYYTPSTAGSYCFQYDIDANNSIAESNENDNGWWLSDILTVNPPAVPDLAFSGTPTTNPASPIIGGSLTVNATVKNVGAAASNATTVTVNIDGYDAGSVSIGSLSAGSSVSISPSVVVPKGISLGSNNIYLTISSVAGETNTSNNEVVITKTFTSGFDFQPQNFSISDTSLHYWGNGGTITVSGQVKNNGSVSASGVKYRLFLNKSGSLYELTNVNPSFFSVNSGSQASVILTGTIPSGLSSYATYKVDVYIDPDGYFTETNESNNSMTTANSVPIQQWSSGGGGGGSVPANSLPAVVTIPIGVKPNGLISVFDKQNYYKTASLVADVFSKNSTADPVNSRNGAFEFEQNDFVLTGRGYPIQISRTYNSKLAERNERFGAGWTSSNHMYYFQDPTSKDVQIYLGGALVSYFASPDNGLSYVAEKGDNNTLYNDGGYLYYKTIDGTKYKFSFRPDTSVTNVGMIDSVIDTNNNITQFTYNTKNGIQLLSSIADPSGRTIQFTYPTSDTDPNWDKVKEIRENLSGTSRLIASYTYNSNNQLTQVHRENFYGTEGVVNLDSFYTYDANGLMLTYTDTRGTVLYNEYDGTGRVIKQYEKNPRLGSTDKRMIYEITYNDSADAGVPGSAHCSVTKNYRELGNYYSDKVCFNSDELKIYRERGTNIEKWTYSATGMPATYADANGNVSSYEYDSKRRLTKETLPDTAWHTVNTFVYEDAFNRLTQKTETVSAVATPSTPVATKITKFAYDSYGNLITATDPLNNIESREYNTNGTLKKYTSKTNQVVNYTYDATGNYVASETAVVIQADSTTQSIAKNYGYDVYGRKISYTDPRNLTYVYKYDYRGNLRQETNPDNQSKYYTYDTEDHRISEIDELNRVTNYTFDTDINASLLKIEKLGNGGPLVYEKQYDWLGNVKAEVDPLLHTTSYTYDSANRVITKADPIKTTSYEYYNNGKLADESNTGGARAYYFYDARNNVIEVGKYYDDSNYITNKFKYDGFDRKHEEFDGKNNTTVYFYDLMDRVVHVEDTLYNHTQYFYDANGNKIGELNPRGSLNSANRNSLGTSNSYVYDGLNRVIKKIDATDKHTLYFYDANGNLTKTIDRQNSDGTSNTHVTNYQYDNLNRQTKATDALGNYSSQTYDVVGNVLTKTDQMNRTWNYTYDAFNRLTDEFDPANNNTHYTYDKAGNKLTVRDSQNKTTQFQYDTLNRLTKVIDPLNNYEEYGYDLLNNRTSVKDKRGYTTGYVYDKLGRLTSETNSQNTVINYTYDANNNRLTENIAGKITSYEYDVLNRASKRIEPGNKIFTFGYDENGNKTSETTANFNSIAYVYDKLDRLSTKTLPEGTVSYGYDQWNNLTSLNDLSGTTNYTYDLLNRNTNEAKTIAGLTGKTFNVVREYFADSQLKSLTDATNKKVNYTYNNRGLLENTVYAGSNLAVYTHATFGKPLTITYGNGSITTYIYDELQRPKSVETKQGVSTLFKQEYLYDSDSNRTQMVEYKLTGGVLTSSTINYTYDSINQVTKADYNHLDVTQDLSYTYDVWGNRTSYGTAFGNTIYNYTANTNQISGLSLNNRLNIAYTTDNNGNITIESHSLLGKEGKTVNYLWTSENKLSAVGYQIPGQVNNSLTFSYDDFGNRVKKSVNGENSYYLNNGLTVLNEIDSAGNVTKTMVNGLAPIAEIDSNNNIQYLNQDILGSTVLITNSTGAIVHQYSFDPFGNLSAELGEDTNNSNYLYTGQEFDAESELYYYNARYYNPLLGRFLSKDPIIHRADGVLGYNEYIYVKNNPLKYTDPSGEEAKKQQEEQSWYSSVWNSTKDFTKKYGTKILDGGQLVLDVVGLVPGVGEIADGANALIYEARGDHLNAGLSATAMIPFAGWLGTGGKLVNKAVKYSDEAVSISKSVIKNADSIPAKAVDTLQYIEKHGAPPPNFKGNKVFDNAEGKLPQGNYKEYDIDPKIEGTTRNSERIVIDQDTGKTWYTSDHYGSFTEIK